MLHHEYDALTGYRVFGGAISFYSVSCMSDVIFNPSLLNWSSLILTVAHMLNATQLVWDGWGGGMITFLWTCTHVECYATCLGWVEWGDDNVPCTCTHVECYATCLGWVGWGDDNVPLDLYTC